MPGKNPTPRTETHKGFQVNPTSAVSTSWRSRFGNLADELQREVERFGRDPSRGRGRLTQFILHGCQTLSDLAGNINGDKNTH